MQSCTVASCAFTQVPWILSLGADVRFSCSCCVTEFPSTAEQAYLKEITRLHGKATYWGNSSSCDFHSGDPLAGTEFPGLPTGWILLASLLRLMTSLDPPHKSHLHFLYPVLVPVSEHHSPALQQWQVSEPGVGPTGTHTAHQPKQLCVLSFCFKWFCPIAKNC